MTVQQLLCGVLPPGLVQYCSQSGRFPVFFWIRPAFSSFYWTKERLCIQARRLTLKCIPTWLSYLPTPSARAGYDTGSIFKRSLAGLNSEFSFSKSSCLTKAEEPNLSYYLPIAGGRIIGFIFFPRVLALCEMQSASSRIWTRVPVSISYNDNHYTTGTIRLWTTKEDK